MKRVILSLVALSFLVLSAGCQSRPAGTGSEGQQSNAAPSIPSTESSSPESAVEPNSSSESPTTDTWADGTEPQQEQLQTARFFIGGNNAQATEVKIDVPADWEAATDTLLVDGKERVWFELVLKFNQDEVDADTHLDNLAKEEMALFFEDLDEEEINKAISEGNIPGMKLRSHKAWVEFEQGERMETVRYYVIMGNKEAFISFIPSSEADADIQQEEFETYLASLELQQ